ncbi:MAG: hypothetical protein GX936_03470 [Clostridiales bacterium]|nr:hypothetical protein [Clostridiales bacterium]
MDAMQPEADPAAAVKLTANGAIPANMPDPESTKAIANLTAHSAALALSAPRSADEYLPGIPSLITDSR